MFQKEPPAITVVLALYMYQMVKVRSVGLVSKRDSGGTVYSVYTKVY